MAKSSLVSSPYIAQITEWSSGVSVNIGRPLVYNSILYRCIQSHITGASFDPSKFEALTGISEAPIDGSLYARKDGGWDTITIDTSHTAVDITANSNGITAGNVVELVSTGGQNVQNIYHCEAPTIGSLATLDGTNNVNSMSVEAFSATAGLACWGIGTIGKYQSLDLSGATPALIGSPATDSYGTGHVSSRLDSTHIAVAGYKGDGSTNGFTLIATYNGTNPVTLSTAANFSTTNKPATCALTSSNWFVAYANTNSDCRVLGVSSNGTNAPTLSAGALDVNGTNNCAYLSLAKLDSSNAMLVLQDTTTSNGVTCRVTDGGIPTASTLGALDGTNNCTYITQSPIDSNHTLCAYNNATTSNGRLAVIQANGTNAPTVVGRAVFSTFSATPNSLTSHSFNLHTLFCRDNSVTGKGYIYEISVDSNYNLTLSQPGFADGTNDLSYQTVAAISPTTAIAAFQGVGANGFAGTLTLTPTPVISGQLVGIASTSATNGATASVDVGPLVTGTYTSGLDYYQSGSGGQTTNATPIHRGKAKSTTELVLDLRGAPEAGKQQVWELTTPGAFTWTAPEDGEYEIVFCGGGGAGCYDGGAGEGRRPMGGNGGNTVQLTRYMSRGASVTGSIGAGAAAVTTFQNGGDGGSTVVLGITAYGGAGGIVGTVASTYQYTSANRPNRGGIYNILGSEGSYYYNGSRISYGGCANLFTETQAVITSDVAGQSGSRGGGGTGSVTGALSGKGGDGCCRITLIHGSGS